MDTDGKNPQNLTNSPIARESHPTWFSPAFSVAPAGKDFVAQTNRAITAFEKEGGTVDAAEI